MALSHWPNTARKAKQAGHEPSEPRSAGAPAEHRNDGDHRDPGDRRQDLHRVRALARHQAGREQAESDVVGRLDHRGDETGEILEGEQAEARVLDQPLHAVADPALQRDADLARNLERPAARSARRTTRAEHEQRTAPPPRARPRERDCRRDACRAPRRSTAAESVSWADCAILSPASSWSTTAARSSAPINRPSASATGRVSRRRRQGAARPPRLSAAAAPARPSRRPRQRRQVLHDRVRTRSTLALVTFLVNSAT